MRPHLSIALISGLLLLGVTSEKCAWDNCPTYDESPGMINVHLISHSHDDLGWIKTVDEYYWGSRKELVSAGVQQIYNTVIQELEKDSTRRFSAAETGFMWRWMVTHNDADQTRFQNLVKNGQIEIIGGGWVQPDEAAAHYMAVLDEHTLGLRYTNTWFGECGQPRTGWQIDPFGHSREIANLHALFGYESYYFARQHYLEHARRQTDKSLEMVWQTSDDLKTNITTGVFYQGNYDSPPGICWDHYCADNPIMDSPQFGGNNVQSVVDSFANTARNFAAHGRSQHVMMLMGSDFQYMNAIEFYDNLDKLIRLVNSNSTNSKLRVFYSTPSCYTAAMRRQASANLPTKSDDFFPYASDPHAYWTGYFTSRPAHKLLVRRASAFLQLVRQLSTFANLASQSSDDNSARGLLDRVVALTQHHDSITGTAQEHVTSDYRLQVSAAITAAADAVLTSSTKTLGGSSVVGNVTYCKLLNETRCAGTFNLSSFTVTAYNPLGQTVTRVFRVPYWGKTAFIRDATGKATTGQLVNTQTGAQWPNVGEPRAPNELVLKATIPPVGFTSLSVSDVQSISTNAIVATRLTKEVIISRDGWSSTSIENENLLVQLGDDGLVASVKDKSSGQTYPLRQYIGYYEGADSNDTQASGAYLFRPKPNRSRVDITQAQSISVVNGLLVNEIRQQFNDWISQVVRLEAGADSVVFDWVVGPMPKEDPTPVTKEVVLRYESGVQPSANVFYTDANGRQTMQRKRDYSASFIWNTTEPIAGNYYPVTTRIHIQDATSAIAILPDRSEGATAYNNVVELMVHRRCFYYDGGGLNEILNEPGVDGKGLIARGQHRLIVGSPQNITIRAQLLAQQIFHDAELGFSGAPSGTNLPQFAGLTADLPAEIHLTTLQILDDGGVLLRLEHVGESAAHFGSSSPITVSLQGLFSTFTVVSATELALAADRPSLSLSNFVPLDDDTLSVTLAPQQIRTFRLGVSRP